jgi:hypothetical protein
MYPTPIEHVLGYPQPFFQAVQASIYHLVVRLHALATQPLHVGSASAMSFGPFPGCARKVKTNTGRLVLCLGKKTGNHLRESLTLINR